MALAQLLRSLQEQAQEALPARTLFWSTDFIRPVAKTDRLLQLFCVCLDAIAQVSSSVSAHDEEGCSNLGVLCGVVIRQDSPVQALKDAICKANPRFAAAGLAPKQLRLRFAGLKVQRPYGHTLLKHLKGIRNGTFVFISWDSLVPKPRRRWGWLPPPASSSSSCSSASIKVAKPPVSAGTSLVTPTTCSSSTSSSKCSADHVITRSRHVESDARNDALLITSMRQARVLPVLVKFESEQAQAGQRGVHLADIWTGARCMLVDGCATPSDLSRQVWSMFEAECLAEIRFFGGRPSASEHRNADFNFYLSLSPWLWQPLGEDVTVSRIAGLCISEAVACLPAPQALGASEPASPSETFNAVSRRLAAGIGLQLLCGFCDDVYYEARQYAIGSWAEEVNAAAQKIGTPLPPRLALDEVSPTCVRTMSGQTVLTLAAEEAEILTVRGLKERIRASCGWDVCRQEVVSQGGRHLHDWDLLPLEGGSTDLLLIMKPGHPAVVALNQVVFRRTRREHDGKPVYHGHSKSGVPCEVLWKHEGPSADAEWVHRMVCQVGRRVFEETSIGSVETFAEADGAVMLSLDEAQAPFVDPDPSPWLLTQRTSAEGSDGFADPHPLPNELVSIDGV